MVHYPFQKLCYGLRIGEPPIVLAASGPTINSFSLVDGSLLGQWPQSRKNDRGQRSLENDEEERPVKRRRVEDDNQALCSQPDSDDSIAIISERQKGERRKPKIESSELPNVSHILCDAGTTTVIAVTAEDKSVCVFDVKSPGTLVLKTRRTMPKRVCAAVLTSDENHLLVGDKFGDVYVLPLHPTGIWKPETVPDTQPYFIPAASELTVHTKGNLAALKQQREHRITQPKKEALTFEHKLLLGHVSLLTDLAIAHIRDESKHVREYILTADRDEHIRVSRGISQAHVIENYCLGHKEFVSKLCFVPWDPTLLVTGGGEPSMKVFHWQSGKLLHDERFEGTVGEEIREVWSVSDNSDRSFDRLSVSNIWPVCHSLERQPGFLLVSFEGVPILFSYSVAEDGQLKHHQSLKVAGNVLDLTSMGIAERRILVSVDTVHAPGSMKDVRPEEDSGAKAFETFQLAPIKSEGKKADTAKEAAAAAALRWESTDHATPLNTAALTCERVETLPGLPARDKGVYSTLGESLYGLENLRKKRDQHAEVDEENEDGLQVDAETAQ